MESLAKILSQISHHRDIDLGVLTKEFPAVCLVGSRAAGCATESSDWDLIVFYSEKDMVNDWCDIITPKTQKYIMRDIKCSESNFGYGLKKSIYGLDLMFEDMNCEHWLKRELCTHTSKYGIWLGGNKFWNDKDIDWKGAVQLKTKLIDDRYHLFQGHYPINPEERCDNEMNDRKRLWCLYNKIPVPPTRMLDEVIAKHMAK